MPARIDRWGCGEGSVIGAYTSTGARRRRPRRGRTQNGHLRYLSAVSKSRTAEMRRDRTKGEGVGVFVIEEVNDVDAMEEIEEDHRIRHIT